MSDAINLTVDFLKTSGITNPDIGIILGTGLGKIINEVEITKIIDFSDIPNFPLATVESHSGN